MAKAILVLDEVEECEDCDLFYIGDFGRSCALVDIKNYKKPSYCPLKELPDESGRGQLVTRLIDLLGRLDHVSNDLDELISEICYPEHDRERE